MAELTFKEAYRVHGFLIEIDGIHSPCPIPKVTGLHEGKVETIEQSEGGSNIVRKIASGVVKFETLVIERNMDGSQCDQLFKAWFNEMFQLHGTGKGSSVRRNGSIIKLEDGKEVLRIAFYEGWVKSSKFSDLESASNNLFKQIIEIEHNGIERVFPA
jgi:phage tail-like protein